jgi:hypothetical protein
MHSTLLKMTIEVDARDFRENAHFAEVFAGFLVETPRVSTRNALIQRFAREEEVYWIGAYIMWCHFARDEEGLTTSRVQAFCKAHGLASPNRIVALMAFLRYGGYLRPLAKSTDRRKRLFELAPRAVSTAKSGYAVHLSAISILIGKPDLVDLYWQDDLLLECIVSSSLRRFIDHGSILGFIPEMRLFTQRMSGYDILMRLLARQQFQGTSSNEAVFFPFDEVAKSSRVSRAHVRRLMIDAERHGFVKLQANGGKAVRLLPKATQSVAYLASLQLASTYQGVKLFLEQTENAPRLNGTV